MTGAGDPTCAFSRRQCIATDLRELKSLRASNLLQNHDFSLITTDFMLCSHKFKEDIAMVRRPYLISLLLFVLSMPAAFSRTAAAVIDTFELSCG